ncbi:zf-TFIIB domain-containing protein [Amylibacter sp. IMCC11727]|uniref:TFIIB-type zinc ribbon-containing protein n=1 Tax=Amylibacter sp. IMCC11727 TaxID=3039851 RepID=UPI00244E06D9|nr:zf-TFIIB domain-containing protein [Amylibacter sp. IMCC11727]WGI20873.1 zf-TFIIB domain-containing protein [Amylibacter sp. IMCC11727]
MQCPIDGAQLVMSDRNGVEIDYCPTCRGVWLDRGELDKIIERSAAAAPQAHPARAADPQDYGSKHDRKPKKKNKMGGFLEDIFDF